MEKFRWQNNNLVPRTFRLANHRLNMFNTVKFRKKAPPNIPLNRPSKYKSPGELVLGNCPQIQSKRVKSPFFAEILGRQENF